MDNLEVLVEDGRVSGTDTDLESWVRDLDIRRLLVAGEVSEDLVRRISSLNCDVRWTMDENRARVAGVLVAFQPYTGGDWSAILRTDGPSVDSRNWRWPELARTDPLDPVLTVFDMLWPTAAMAHVASRFSAGDLVRLLGGGGVGRVKAVRHVGDAFEYTVSIDGQDRKVPEPSLEIELRDPHDPSFWIGQEPSSARDMARTLTWTKLRHPLTDVLYSYRSSRTVFRAYQFRPVLKTVNSDRRRLLIADEVGLGKTIEAGLIWNELDQRGDVQSVLVVCPSTLRFKWQRELRNRFDRQVRVLSRAELRSWVEELEEGGGRDFQGIVSLELLRSTEDVLERLQVLSPRLDLVIVDEAHYLRNTGTKSNELGGLLAELADALIFLSATPLNLHAEDLFNLLHLLDEQAFPVPEILFEQVEPNRIVNAAARSLLNEGRSSPRQTLTILLGLSASSFGRVVEKAPDYQQLTSLLDQAEPLTHAQVAVAKRHLMELHTLAPIFTRTRKVDTPERKAVREPHDRVVHWTDDERGLYDAIYAEVVGRAARLGQPLGFVTQMPLRQAASCLPVMQDRLKRQMVADWSDEDEPELDVDSLSSFTSPISRPLPVDSKYELFRETVKDALKLGSNRVLVFSFFKGTLEYLKRRLAADLGPSTSVELMYGPTPSDERERIMNDFRGGVVQVLLCSEVGSEGLDFQFCNALINYDLPWNPMRIEQRIGRIDRFGQESEKVFIFNMQVPGTIETEILNRLYARIGVFERTIGDLEPILRDLDAQLGGVLDPQLTPVQRQRRIDEVAIALEARAKDLEELSSTDSLMNGIGDLLIDGFDSDGPGGGRYLGRDEIRSFVEDFVTGLGGRLRRVQGLEHAYTVTGDALLAQALRRTPASVSGLQRPVQLAALVESDGFTVTFDEQEAVAHALPLVNVTHPLVRAAVDHLAGDELLLHRFGVVSLPTAQLTRPVVAGLYLMESRGLRPGLEMVCLAVDTDGHLVEGLGDHLLTALARNELTDAEYPVGLDVNTLYSRVDLERAALAHRRDLELKLSNDSLVERRIAVREREFHLKIERAERTLDSVLSSRRQERVVRMNEGRLRNLRLRLDEVVADLESKREASVSTTEVAVLVIQP